MPPHIHIEHQNQHEYEITRADKLQTPPAKRRNNKLSYLEKKNKQLTHLSAKNEDTDRI